MSESAPPPPPPYEEVEKTSLNQNSNSNWQAWYKKLIELKFNQDEAIEYANLFVNNDVEISMIQELNDDILKGLGIEKVGHRIRILRLQERNSFRTSPQAAAAAAAVIPPSVFNTPRCAWHPNVAANEKCRKCHRLVCLNCRREKVRDYGVRYYCQNCYEDCTIL